jgi:hypothetical protein
MVKDKISVIDNSSIENIDDIIKYLVKLKSLGWTHVEAIANVDYDIYGGQEYSVIATKTREENDVEYNKRINIQKGVEEYDKKNRRLQYERLKKEFEG